MISTFTSITGKQFQNHFLYKYVPMQICAQMCPDQQSITKASGPQAIKVKNILFCPSS